MSWLVFLFPVFYQTAEYLRRAMLTDFTYFAEWSLQRLAAGPFTLGSRTFTSAI
jgi:hypothetical protein